MAKEVVTKVIDKHSFEFYPMAPVKALNVLTRLTKQAGGPIGTLMANMNGVSSFKQAIGKQMDMGQVGGALTQLLTSLDEKMIEVTIMDLMQNVMIDQRALHFDTDFEGKPDLMLKVALEALKANYAGFFTGQNALGAMFKNQTSTPVK